MVSTIIILIGLIKDDYGVNKRFASTQNVMNIF